MTRVSSNEAGPSYDAGVHYGTRGYEKDKHYVSFGSLRGVLYRRADIGSGSWFLRVHIREEGRHYRKSLHTTDRKDAVRKAQDLMVEVFSRVKSGQKLLAPSLKDVAREFDKHQQELAAAGQLSPRTVVMQRYRVNLGLDFVKKAFSAGLDTKVSAVDGAVFNDYLAWRTQKAKEDGRSIRRDVVRDELLVIRKLFLFAVDRKLCSQSAIPTWRFAVEKIGPRRKRMTTQEYTHFLRLTRAWALDGQQSRDIYNRQLLLHFVLVVSSTGLRSGELFGLRNRDVQIRREDHECAISVLPEYSKVRRGRDIVIVGSRRNPLQKKPNPLIRWIDTHQRHKNASDFVFATYEDGAVSARDTYYRTYKKLRSYLKAAKGPHWLDTYHCRHHWITTRLLAEEPIHLVAKAAGTSTSQIEDTYSHVLTSMTTRRFGRKEVVYAHDGSYKIVTSRQSEIPNE